MFAARVIGEKQEGWAKSAPPPSTARVKPMYVLCVNYGAGVFDLQEIRISHTCNIARLNRESQALKWHVHFTTLLKHTRSQC